MVRAESRILRMPFADIIGHADGLTALSKM